VRPPNIESAVLESMDPIIKGNLHFKGVLAFSGWHEHNAKINIVALLQTKHLC